MKRNSYGFNLVELMVVVAIIGILTAVALPAWRNHTMKASFTEILSLSTGYQAAVDICARTLGTVTGCNAGSNDIPAVDTGAEHVTAMSIVNGVIRITSNVGSNYTSVMTPTLATGPVRWTQSGTCQGADLC